MKKLIFIIGLLLLLLPRVAFALLDADTIFEFRSEASVNMVGGGGFNSTNAAPGNDLSTYLTAALIEAAYPASGKFSGTDLVLDDGDANPGVISSATHNFVAADCGNIIHIYETGTGFTVGWYEIVSTSGNKATLDRAAGTVDGQKTGGDWQLGGALNVGGSLEDDFFEEISGANAADGITVYFYNNNSTPSVTFTPSEQIAISGTGGASAPIKVIGYKTTRGDKPTGTSRPTLACGANTWSLGNNFETHHIISTGTGTGVIASGSTGAKHINCKFTNSSTTANRNAFTLQPDTIMVSCEAVSYRGDGVDLGTNSGNIFCSYIHDSNIGIYTTATAGTTQIVGNIFSTNINSAISLAGANARQLNIFGNTIHGAANKLGTGISMVTGCTDVFVYNNIITGFVTGVSHADAQTVGYDDYNDYYNNTTDVSNWTKGANDQAVDPQFTSVGQVTGTTATYAGSTLTDAGKFASVVAGQDYIYIISGTGMTAGIYGITTATADTVITDIDAGENVAGDIVYQITTGRNFAIGANLKALGYPGAFPGGLTTGYMDIGAVQRQEPAGGGGGAWGSVD